MILSLRERYRDVIAASDSILQLEDISGELCKKFEDLGKMFSPDKLDEAWVKNQHSALSPNKAKDRNRVFPIAAMMKLLVDTPEQVWNCIEIDNYLKAAWLFLAARQIKSVLEECIVSSKLSGLENLFKRQWNSISNFKQIILKQCLEYMNRIELNATALNECIYATMLLDNVSDKEVLEIFLNERQSSMNAIFDQYHSDNYSLSTCICQAAMNYRNSAASSEQVFGYNSEGELKQTLLSQIIVEMDKRTDSIANLYDKSKTNIYVLIKYLPDSVKFFKPRASLMLSPQQQQSTLLIENWKNEIFSILQNKSRDVFRFSRSLETLFEAKRALLDQLIALETDAGGEWNSIWGGLYRNLFNDRARQIFKELCKNLVENYVNQVYDNIIAELDVQSWEIEGHVAEYQWNKRENLEDALNLASNNSENFGNTVSTSNFKLIGSDTPAVKRALSLFSTQLNELCSSFSRYNALETNSDLFNLKQDSEAFEQYGVEQLYIMFQDLNQRFGAQVEIYWKEEKRERAIFLARLGQELDLECRNSVRKVSHNKDTKFDSQEKVIDLYNLVFDKWIDSLKKEFEEYLSEYLNDSDWISFGFLINKMTRNKSSGAWFGGTWELLEFNSTDENNKPVQEFTYLPAQPTIKLVTHLEKLCQDIQNIAGIQFPAEAAKKLTYQLLKATFTQFKVNFSDKVWFSSDGSQKILLQLYFDFLFLWRCFTGSIESSDHEKIFQQFSSIRNCLRELIDPIEFQIIEPSLQANLEKSWSRYYILLYVFTQFSPIDDLNSVKSPDSGSHGESDSLAKTSQLNRGFLTENHQIFSSLPSSTRFTLLPTSFVLPRRQASDQMGTTGPAI